MHRFLLGRHGPLATVANLTWLGRGVVTVHPRHPFAPRAATNTKIRVMVLRILRQCGYRQASHGRTVHFSAHNEMYHILGALNELASRHALAIIVVTHMNKATAMSAK